MQTATKKQRAVFAIVLPLFLLILGYWLVLGTAHGQGSSIGFRALGVLISSPVALVFTLVWNYFLAYRISRTRAGAFLLGMIAPLAELFIEYAYLWQIWKEYPEIG